MSSHAAARIQRPIAPTPTPSERSSLLHWRRRPEEALPQVATEAPARRGLWQRLARSSHPPVTAHPTAEAHARHFWHIDRPQAHARRPYEPGIADAVRLNALMLSAEGVLVSYAAAGFMDAIFPTGSTVLNPEGTRHEMAGIAWVLGAYLGYQSVVPALVGNLYGALLFGCTKVNDRLRAHPVTTRLSGYAGVSILGWAAVTGAVVLHMHNNHHDHARLPEQGWQPSVYSAASVYALAASAPGMAALGWYVGRIGSAMCHGRPED